MSQRLYINESLEIPLSELRFQFARGSGPGGQNVNKVETRVELIYDVAHSACLTDKQRATLMVRLAGKISEEGILRIASQESRSQWQNREKALIKFIQLIGQALKPVKPRRKTSVPRGQKERRRQEKKRRSELKSHRRKPE
ncbi:MAG TPA: alternative ribosome rescue aminoacyl-tRNA hydrolase ArfB [Bacteroidota bacterium]|nr:alternative ribosome rescue aminoacyl-tRNA hydrolase ArfB [Bacteroidota bacterium]